MGNYLNPGNEKFRRMIQSEIYVDKTGMIKYTNSVLDTAQNYVCVSRPRRFGKSMAANMLTAYYSRGCDSKKLFHSFEIAKDKDFEKYLNQYNTIFLNMQEFLSRSYNVEKLIERVKKLVIRDLKMEYPEVDYFDDTDLIESMQDIYAQTQCPFVVIIDEWDCIFREYKKDKEAQEKYLDFLRDLLKDKACIYLSYMTGILPIAKYSSGSELNMFWEYNMASETKYSEYFGFTDEEVDELFERYEHNNENAQISRQDLRIWYDGYTTKSGERIYNPRSVVLALTNNNIGNYWTSSGPYDEIFYYIRKNIDDVQNDLALMISGESVQVKIQEYAAAAMRLETKSEIFSAMVVYGFLSYEDGKVRIPNKELMNKFDEMIQKEESLGYVYRLAKESERMLQATLAEDTQVMEEILEYAHNTETPILSYNNETELSAIINLVYLSARDKYRVEREDKAGKGFVDYIFYPENKKDPGIILELKVDHSPREALKQIVDKDYKLKFQGKIGEIKTDHKILGVGISYDKKTKKHSCVTQWL